MINFSVNPILQTVEAVFIFVNITYMNSKR
jgi:hypothetical protein